MFIHTATKKDSPIFPFPQNEHKMRDGAVAFAPSRSWWVRRCDGWWERLLLGVILRMPCIFYSLHKFASENKGFRLFHFACHSHLSFRRLLLVAGGVRVLLQMDFFNALNSIHSLEVVLQQVSKSHPVRSTVISSATEPNAFRAINILLHFTSEH